MYCQTLEARQHFFVGKPTMPLLYNSACQVEGFGRHHWRKGAVRADPHLWCVSDVLSLEFERGAIVDVVPNVLFIRQHLMNRISSSRPTKVRHLSLRIQVSCNLGLAASICRELLV